jgi:ATP-dependent RNA circularization protein (DNA/RNA ligase family)
MNKKIIKYISTSLVMINCFLSIPKITVADVLSDSNDLESSASYTDNNSNEKDKHKGFDVFSEENHKYLSSEQKKDLLKIKQCKEKGDELSQEQQKAFHTIIETIVKGKLGEKNYEDYKCLIEKKKANQPLTEEEDKNLKEYRAIINGSKLSNKEILKQFLR